jgi:LuxR family maltose regulon positive regulatory protein
VTTTILKTKLSPPTLRENLISRSGLIEQLTQGQSRKLTLISAPAGFGKTSLLVDWIHKLPGSCSWISLDEEDNETGRFLAYLFASIQESCPDISGSLAYQSLPTTDGDLSDLMIPLINQIAEICGELYLVLDDYHQIDNPDIHGVIIYLVDNCPDNLHLVISTRADPPLRLAQYRGRGELVELRGEQLRFSVPDTERFIETNFGISLPLSDLELLTKKTEGWIAGIQLAGISLRDHPNKTAFIAAFAGDDRYVADYLVDEALNRQSGRVQDFLLKSSILTQFCGSLCDAVTGQSDSQEILEEIERSNLFLVALDNQRCWYRYHPLFADLLQIRLNARMPDAIGGLHASASEWFEAANFTAQAVVHAVQAGDLHLLEKILQEFMLDMLEEGHSVRLQKMLQEAFASSSTFAPWVEIARAWSAVYSGMLDTADRSTARIEASLAETDMDEAVFNKAAGHLAAIRAYISDMLGDKEQNLFHARRAIELLPKDDYLTGAFAAMMLATAHHRNGQSERAYEVLMTAIRSCQDKHASHVIIDLHCMLAQTYHMLGRHQDSIDTLAVAYEMARQRSEALNSDLPIIGFIRILKARILYEWNQLEQAKKEVEAGLGMIQSGGENDSYLAGLIMSIRVKIALGELEAASRDVQRALDASKEIPYWHQVIEVLEALTLAKAGRERQVEAWLNSHQDLFEQEPDYQQYGSMYHLIELLLELGDYHRASSLSDRMLTIIKQGDSSDLLVRFLVLRSFSLFCLGEEDQALAFLERAVLESSEGMYIRTYLDRGEKMAKLLYLAIQREVVSGHCQELLGQWPVLTFDSAAHAKANDSIVEQLTNRELEVLQLLAEGKSNKEIAGDLVLSLYTVKSHARNIYGKLGAKNRTQAVAQARLLGILPQG